MISLKKCHCTLRKLAVRDEASEVVGWYLYYFTPGKVAQVIQIEANNHTIGKVLDHLIYDAWQQGAIALSGRLEPRFMSEFSDRYCLFNRGYNWMLIHSQNPELLNVILRGNAFLTRLEGEWWIPIMGESFN